MRPVTIVLIVVIAALLSVILTVVLIPIISGSPALAPAPTPSSSRSATPSSSAGGATTAPATTPPSTPPSGPPTDGGADEPVQPEPERSRNDELPDGWPIDRVPVIDGDFLSPSATVDEFGNGYYSVVVPTYGDGGVYQTGFEAFAAAQQAFRDAGWSTDFENESNAQYILGSNDAYFIVFIVLMNEGSRLEYQVTRQ